MPINIRTLALLSLTLMIWGSSQAQLQRGPRTVVRAGMIVLPDSLQKRADSIAREAIVGGFDDLIRDDYRTDSAVITALRTDDIRRTDSLLRTAMAKGKVYSLSDSIRRANERKKNWFMSDSMSLSKMCWVSMVLPGYGQVYNKQYWKLPILYGLVGSGLGLFLHENKTYRPLKSAFDSYTDVSLSRSPELDALQNKMIRSNTRRQLFLGITVASYIYFVGDAAVNYSTNEVSDIKKATTLACIFPGAGQIYNKSYWKVPFVVGGFAAMIYCIDWNNRGFQRFKKAYTLRADFDKNPGKYPEGSTDEFRGRYSTSFLKNLKDSYRRNRDLCLIVSGALYVLQIVDAHVDAHLKDYDVSDDLTMNIEPLVNYAFSPSAGRNRPVFGFNLSMKF